MLIGASAGPGANSAGERTAKAPKNGAASRPVSFVNEVMPLLGSLGCNATKCHGAVRGQGGLKLSMFGADPERDYAAVTRADEGRRINWIEPRKSLLLLKATGSVEHGGQQRIKPDSAECELLSQWLLAGAPLRGPNERQIVAVEAAPELLTLAPGQTGRLSAMAVFDNGTRQDISRDALYRSLDESVASPSRAGAVQAKGSGQTFILVTCNRRSAVVRVAVPRPKSASSRKAEVHNKIDELVLMRLKELNIPASGLCTDGEFVRRVYLDAIGRLPAPDEIRRFLDDERPEKRSRLIDRLLDSSEFADFWALKWGDLLRIKAEYPSNLWPNAAQAYYYWVRDSIAQNKPYDRFVRELLLSSGSDFRDPPANYYRAVEKRNPKGFAESTALVFLGVRLACASCHAHPTEAWTLDDNLGMAAFFPQIKFKNTGEWKEEIVYLDPEQILRDPRTKTPIPPRFLDGTQVDPQPGEDLRGYFAEWLVAPENPWFAKNVVNRIWFWLLGRGIVHEPDDLRPTNPPSNEPLLAFLEKELTEHQFDLKHVYRLILNSATYQRSSAPVGGNEQDTQLFSHYPIKRLTAEQLSDALGQVTQVWDSFSSQIPEPYSRWPSGFRATQMWDGSVGTPFLELFGRPPRDTAYESDRDCRTSMRQALFLINSAELDAKVARSPRLKQWQKDTAHDDAIVDELFLMALSRLPTEAEKQAALKHIPKDPKARNDALADLLWATLNTKEFLFNH
jgi:hypothetical protein